MQYMISFLEGIVTFISPCLLPMLPIYISYFAGGGEHADGFGARRVAGGGGEGEVVGRMFEAARRRFLQGRVALQRDRRREW